MHYQKEGAHYPTLLCRAAQLAVGGAVGLVLPTPRRWPGCVAARKEAVGGGAAVCSCALPCVPAQHSVGRCLTCLRSFLVLSLLAFPLPPSAACCRRLWCQQRWRAPCRMRSNDAALGAPGPSMPGKRLWTLPTARLYVALFHWGSIFSALVLWWRLLALASSADPVHRAVAAALPAEFSRIGHPCMRWTF